MTKPIETKTKRSDYETRMTRVTVVKRGAPIFDRSATNVSIVDEAGGEFVEVEQCTQGQSIRIDPAEWADIKAAIGIMIEACRKEEEMNP